MLTNRTINYAAPPPGYFWAWSSDHDAVEWYGGATLAMWQELHGVLNFLGEDSGLPPLGAVLLLLAACRDEWIASCIPFHEKVMTILRATESDAIPFEIKDTLVRGLKTVNDLPKDLRSSFGAKCLLVSALFEGGPHSLPRDESAKILADLSIHGPRRLQGSLPEMDARARFLRDLRALRIGLARHDAASLEALLRTGLENCSIQPAPLAPMPTHADDPRFLLERLMATGGETGAAAAVAKRAIAMMNFPGSFGTPRDLPVGGISDITNRGTIDRLLPGELAWDDLVLAARLVHNEALYFRREIPPMHVAVGHTVLLDRGLRLWGTGRVFALGVALGLRHHPALNGPGETFTCIAASHDGFGEIDLSTPPGVHSALEPLIPAAGPDAFLTAWWETAVAADDDAVPDLSFVTAKEHLEVASTRGLLGEIASWIHGKSGHFRVLALGRGGDVEVEAWSPGGNRPLFRGEVDHDGILPGPRAATPSGGAPAPPLRVKPDPLQAMLPLYALDRLPFLFPQIPQGKAFLSEGPGLRSPVIGVSIDRRLMRWPRTGWGGVELAAKVPGRQHWMSWSDHREPVVIASGSKAGDSVRVFRIAEDRLHEIQIAASRHAFPRLTTVSGGAVLLGYSDCVEALSLATGNREAVLPVKNWAANPVLSYDGEKILVAASANEPAPPLEGWPFGEKLWPRLFSPEKAALVEDTLCLMSGGRTYRFDPLGLAWEEAKPSDEPFVPFLESDFSPVHGVKLTVARLGDRLEIWHDPRGMLHLRNPADPDAPQWVVLTSHAAAAAWHPSWGLCSMEPRLRMPTAEEPGALALRDLQSSLTGQRRTLLSS